MSFSDEAERREAVYRRSMELLESSGELLDQVQQRDIPTEYWQPSAPEPPRSAPPAPRQQQPTPVEVSKAWQDWADKRIERKLHTFAGMLGSEVGKVERETRRDLGERITEAESNLVTLVALQEQAITELRTRVEQLEAAEQRTGPRLVHDADAA